MKYITKHYIKSVYIEIIALMWFPHFSMYCTLTHKFFITILHVLSPLELLQFLLSWIIVIWRVTYNLLLCCARGQSHKQTYHEMMRATEYPHFMKLHLVQNIQQVLWCVMHCPTLLKLKVLELKATHSQSWCLLQWCDVSVTVMPSSWQRMPEHTIQATFYYAEVICIADRNFLVPHNESSTYWRSWEMEVSFFCHKKTTD